MRRPLAPLCPERLHRGDSFVVWREAWLEGYVAALKDTTTEQLTFLETTRDRYGCTEDPCREHG